jgi:hypothetical protein
MDEINPYAPPKSLELEETRLGEHVNAAWRDRKYLKVRKGAVLPDRCLKCNEPAEGYQFKRSLSWASPYYAVLILCGVLIYILVYLVVRRHGKVTVGVCPLHRRNRKRAILAGWLIALVGIGSIIAAGMVPDQIAPIAAISGIVLLLAGLIGGVFFGSRILVPARIDKHYIWLSKVSPEFLATFPDANVQ